MNLYDISNAYRAAMDALIVDEDTGEAFGTEELEAVGEDFDRKVEDTACYIKEQLAFAASCKEEAVAMVARAKSAERKAAALKEYLRSCMETAQVDSYKGVRAQVGFRRSVAVHITDEGKIPQEYMTPKTTFTPDKAAIREAINAGKTVTGAEMVETRNIQIK